MKETDFDRAFDRGELNDQYAEFIMNNAGGDRIICNGDTLISAMEDGYLYWTFKDSLVTEEPK